MTGSHLRRPEPRAVCRLQLHLRQRPQGLRPQDQLREPGRAGDVERYTILQAIDKLWQEHLYEMDSLRYSIGLRAHGQRDPLMEYKAEAFKIFDELMVNIKTEICHNIFRSASSLMAFENFLRNAPQQTCTRPTSAFGGGTSTGPPAARAIQGQRRRQRSRRRGGSPPRPSPSAPAPRSAATTRALAAAARNTSIAAGSNRRRPPRACFSARRAAIFRD